VRPPAAANVPGDPADATAAAAGGDVDPQRLSA
jgi:hypothetical protein